MANNLFKLVVAGVQLVGRAFGRALRKEFAASNVAAEKAGGGKKGAESAASSSLFGMSLDEAKQILNVNDIKDAEKLTKNYEHLMKVNEKASGGSFYLQSKVFRAKERIDSELKSNQQENNNSKNDSS